MNKKKIFVTISSGQTPCEELKEAPKDIVDLLSILEKVFHNNESCENKVDSTPTSIQYYVEALAHKMDWHPKRMANFLDNLWEISPISAFSVLLREIAVELDKKYKDHIECSDKIYVISTFDGRIHEVCKAHIKNYRNFAAFRTIEDAKFACNILREDLRDMFRSGGKQEN